jgi:lysophospholipase L1-like esterase
MSKVILTGSSIFQAWTSAADAVQGREVVNRAVGGTITAYWVENLSQVLTDEAPDAVLLYCGSNDVSAEVPPEEIIRNTALCRALIRRHSAEVQFAYFGIMRAPQKEGKWDLIDRINAAVRSRLEAEDLYVEPNDVLVDGGVPIARYFVEDGLHLTQEAYAALGAYAAPRLSDWLKS